ncbi:LOW QUALITY PROTEIN: HMCN1-like protein [Mya arenaria]|uniref:HMCN1-like protein n=1 Tax=Mya arenaria TaxID=6604 RepID=A0ABY7G010_MYAAR|nr:LOW QUALITY PROTEIN: HMCN1-like protein [Mya arenaria]
MVITLSVFPLYYYKSREAGRTGKAGEYVAVTTSATDREHVTILHLKITAPFVKDSHTNLKAVFEEVMTSVRVNILHAQQIILIMIFMNDSVFEIDIYPFCLSGDIYTKVHGRWSMWVDTSDCSASCGDAYKTQSRTCTNPAPHNGGENCFGSSKQNVKCPYVLCPVDGGWSYWTEWTQCSVTCDGQGTQSRNRSCDNPHPLFGGAKCQGDEYAMRDCRSPDKCASRLLMGGTPCGTNGDIVLYHVMADGVVGIGYVTDNATIPGLQQGGMTAVVLEALRTRQFVVLILARLNLLKIANKNERDVYKLMLVDGHWSLWGNWTECSVTCGEGQRSRNRSCSDPKPAFGGENCTIGSFFATETCRNVVCPVDGGWGTWESWSICDCENEQNRKRKCENPSPVGAGKQCEGNYTQIIGCIPDASALCPTQGGWTNWYSWMACSATCGHGTHLRLRLCENPKPEHGGRYFKARNEHNSEYIHLKERVTSLKLTLFVNGNWGEWERWGACDKSCNTGHQSRNRTCSNPEPAYGGQNCNGDNIDTTACNTQPCPVNGVWGEWGHWTGCDVTCSFGNQMRNRSCDNPLPEFGGQECAGEESEFQKCKKGPCPIDGKWSGWGLWSECSVTCLNGTKSRNRTCDNPSAQYNGADCVGSYADSTVCSPRDTCDGKPLRFTYMPSQNQISQHLVQYKGADCQICDQIPTQFCAHKLKLRFVYFSVNGGWSEWGSYTQCDATCGSGTKTTFRACDNPRPENNGLYCQGNFSKSTSCFGKPCPVDGAWNSWMEWGACSTTCQTGFRIRSRVCDKPANAFGGKPCPGSFNDNITCFERECPVDGGMSDWSEWSTCSHSCGTGTQTRNRTCTNPTPLYGGAYCMEDNNEDQLCLVVNCPINGYWSDWAAWGACDVTCGNGTMTRSRSCDNPQPEFGGEDCVGNATDVTECPDTCCPVDGNWALWYPWSPCQGDCSKGTRSRFRNCNNPLPSCGGNQCDGKYRQTDDICLPIGCSTIDGKWSGWGVWSECSVTCLNGTKSRNRTCDNPPAQYNGADCVGSFTDSDVCLPRDYCNSVKSYSSQYKSRNRTCDNPPAQYNGADCVGSYSESKSVMGLEGPHSSPRQTNEKAWLESQLIAARHPLCLSFWFSMYGSSIGQLNIYEYDGSQRPGKIAWSLDGNQGNKWQQANVPLTSNVIFSVRWSAWFHGPCSVTCGTGIQTRLRHCNTGHVVDCPGNKTETIACQMKPCPGAWSSWFNLPCSTTCGNGTRTRLRHCSSGHVDDCSGKNTDNVTCNMTPCIGTSNSCKRCNMKVHFENGSVMTAFVLKL